MNKFLLFIVLLVTYNGTLFTDYKSHPAITSDQIAMLLDFLLKKNNIDLLDSEPQSIIDNFIQQLVSNPQVSNSPDKVEVILTTFVQMLHNFSNVLSEPKDPSVVGPNIAKMLAGIISIAMHARRYSSRETDKKMKNLLKPFVKDQEQEKRLIKSTKNFIKAVRLAHID